MMYFLILLFISGGYITSQASESDFKESPNERDKWIQSTYTNENVETPINFNLKQRRFSESLPNAPEGVFAKGSKTSSQTWMHAGPNNIGGRSRVVVFDKSNPNILIAGGVSGGIWRSVDAGNSWVQTAGINELASVTTIIQDPRQGKNNIWYCAGGEISGNSASMSNASHYSGNGIYQSTDNGISWHTYGSTGDAAPQTKTTIDYVCRLAIDPTNKDEDVLYAACYTSIVRITNNGNKIEQALDLEDYKPTNKITDILITPGGKFYATLSYATTAFESSHHGIFYSEDGYSWTDISPDFLKLSCRIIMDYAESNENILYFFSSNYAGECQNNYPECYSIFKLDHSEGVPKWTNLSNNVPYFASKNSNNYIIAHIDYCMALEVSPVDPDIIFLAGANCYVSYDGFSSVRNTQWIAGYSPEYDPYKTFDQNNKIGFYKNRLSSTFETGGWDFHYFAFNPNNPKEIISASDAGLHKLADISQHSDKNWISLNNGYHTTQLYDCAINEHEIGSDDIIGGFQDNSTLGNLNDNSKFTKLFYGDGISCHITGFGSIIVSSQRGTIARLDMKDGEVVDFDYLFSGAAQQLSPQFQTIFAVNPQNEKEVALATNQAILICEDITEEQNNNQYSGSIIDNLYATSVTYGKHAQKMLLVGTAQKRIFRVHDFHNNDLQYEIIPLPDYVTGSYVSDLWVAPNDNDHFIAIVSNYLSLGMLETTDGGKTWTDHGGNLEENPDGSGAGHSFRCYDRMVYEGDTLHLLGTSDGLFATKKLEGANTVWMRESANTIGKAVITDIETRNLDGRIVIATHGNGLFKTNYATSVQDFDGQNLGFVVSEVYPNPTTDQINFVLNSDKPSFVEAKIVDISGNIVAKIISEDFVGTKHIEYNAAKLAQGTYFLNISDGTHYVTKKINIIR